MGTLESLEFAVGQLRMDVERMQSDLETHIGPGYGSSLADDPHPYALKLLTAIQGAGFSRPQSLTGSEVILGGVLTRGATAVTINNSAAETALISFTLPANALGTDRLLHYVAYGSLTNNSGAGRTVTPKIKIGSAAVTLFEDASPSFAASAAARQWVLEVWIGAQNSIASVVMGGLFFVSEPTATTTGRGDLATADTVGRPIGGSTTNIDTTKANTFEVSMTLSAADANLTLVADYQVLELK